MSYNLLFLSTLVSEEFTDTAAIIATALIALLLVIIALFTARKKLNTKEIVYAGVAISASFVLSFIKFAPVQYGGSITLASFVPLIVYCYFFGFVKSLLATLIYGLLQFIQDPYVLTPATFALDYLLAFAAISVAGLFKNNQGMSALKTTLCVCSVYLTRFIMHFISGVIYFNEGMVWANLPANSAIGYSLLYQVVYLVPDMIICLVVMLIINQSGILQKIKPKTN